MAGINHQPVRQAGATQQTPRIINGEHIVIGLFTPTQDDVAVGITPGFKNRGVSLFGDREKMVCPSGSANGINRHLHIAIGRVFKAHRTG